MNATTPAPAALDGRAPLVAAGLAGAVAGIVPAVGPTAVALVGAVAAGLALQALGWKRLVTLLIASTFVTRFRVDVLGGSFRPEHLVLFVCAGAMLSAGRGHALASAAADRTSVLFGCFVAWSAVVSVLQAPKVGESLLIVGWLALDWLLLVVFIASGRSAPGLTRSAVCWAGVAAGVGVGMWVAAEVAGFSWGAHTDPLGNVSAALGLSFEPNLFGATAALWAFVAVTGVRSLSPRATAIVTVVSLAALALSLTRSAMVALPLGLLAWGLRAGKVARKRISALVLVCAVMFLAVGRVVPAVSERIGENASKALAFESGTGGQRLAGWRTAVGDLDGLDWIIGLGSNSFGQRHLDPTLPTDPHPAYLSNLPLQILYDTGVVGSALLVAVVVSTLSRRRIRDGRALGLLVVYTVCALATSPFWYGTTWLLVAIAVLDRRRIERRGDERRGPSPVPGRTAPEEAVLQHHRPVVVTGEEALRK